MKLIIADDDGNQIESIYEIDTLTREQIVEQVPNWIERVKAQSENAEEKANMAVAAGFNNTPHIKVEYDLNWDGGNYTSVGQFAYVPVALIEAYGGMNDNAVWQAFKRYTGHDFNHVVNYESTQLFNDNGSVWWENKPTSP